jgi:cytochrome c-type biogenesis protein CcmF
MSFAESGTAALAIAIVLGAYTATTALAGHFRGLPELRLSAERAALAATGMVTYAALVLFGLLLTHQFSVAFVAEVSSREMSTRALLSAFWGGQAGSLLFRTWMLTVFTGAVVLVQRRRERSLLSLTVATLAVVEVFFLLVVLVSTNPFAVQLPAPADGQGLNPLLQDEAMSFHPPLLLTGYIAFTVPFAVAVAGLLSGQMGIGWLRAIRRWTLVAWTIQGCGLLAGAWWAYHVLGWGGYWGWDPVENVALLPWVAATAFLHSLMVQERRGMLRIWNVCLAAGAFCLAIFGMFLVTSGVVTSVHAFAASADGPLFFGFLAALLLGLVALVAYRLPLLRSEGRFDALASRESAFLLNNLLLVAVVVATFWGTIFPMVSETFRGIKIGVGPAFYQQINTPILIALVFLMGIGPLLAWRRTALPGLVRNLTAPVLTAAAVWALLVLLGMRQGLAALAFAACAMTAVAIAVEYGRGIAARRRSGEGFWLAVRTLIERDRRRYAGYLVHLAVVLLAVGVIGSTFQTSREFILKVDQTATIGRYTFQYLGEQTYQRPDYAGVYAVLAVTGGGRSLGVVQPERRVYLHWENQPVTGVAIMTTRPWLDDVYVLFTDLDAQNSATFRVYLNPLVSLIWAGGGLFIISALLLFLPQRRARPAFHPVSTGKAITSEA